MLLEQPVLEVSSNMKFGNLATQWCFGSEANKVWKCTCSCGGICYVKETALQQGEVEDCGSSIHKRLLLLIVLNVNTLFPTVWKHTYVYGVVRRCLINHEKYTVINVSNTGAPKGRLYLM